MAKAAPIGAERDETLARQLRAKKALAATRKLQDIAQKGLCEALRTASEAVERARKRVGATTGLATTMEVLLHFMKPPVSDVIPSGASGGDNQSDGPGNEETNRGHANADRHLVDGPRACNSPEAGCPNSTSMSGGQGISKLWNIAGGNRGKGVKTKEKRGENNLSKKKVAPRPTHTHTHTHARPGARTPRRHPQPHTRTDTCNHTRTRPHPHRDTPTPTATPHTHTPAHAHANTDSKL